MSLEPRWRLALAVVASVLVSQTTSLLWLAAMLWAAMMGLGAVLWQRRDRLQTACRRVLGVNTFVAMLWLVLPWSFQGGELGLDGGGIALATLLSLRINAIALICTALLTGLDAFAVARAAAQLGLPPRLSRLLLLMVRYLGVLDDTRRRIDRAMRARGFRATASARTLAVIAHQLALVLVHAIVRAERVEMAMRARGWARHEPSERPDEAGDLGHGRPGPAADDPARSTP